MLSQCKIWPREQARDLWGSLDRFCAIRVSILSFEIFYFQQHSNSVRCMLGLKNAILLLIFFFIKLLNHLSALKFLWNEAFHNKHLQQHALSSRRRASGKHPPVSETAPVTTQDLLAQKGGSAWQTMRHLRTPTLWPVSDSEESNEDRVLKRNFTIVGF